MSQDTIEQFRTRAEDIDNKDGFYVPYTILGAQPLVASAYGIFFTAKRPCEVLWCSVRYAGTNAGALTLDIVKCADGTAAASGSSLLATTFNLDTTADTLQTRSGLTLLRAGTTQLKENQSLACVRSGTLTNIAHISITVYLKYLDKGDYR